MADIPATDADELERLRQENAALRTQLEQPTGEPPHRARWRWPVAAILLVLSGILLVGSVLAVWAGRTILNNARYTETVTPLIDSSAVRSSVAVTAVDRLFAKVDVEATARQALPPKADFLAPSISDQLHTYSVSAAEKALATPQARKLWVEANRRAQARIVPALLGDAKSPYVDINSGTVSIDISQIVAQVKSTLASKGVNIVQNVPNDVAGSTYTLFQSKSLAQAQSALQALKSAAIVLPILTLILIVGAILLAPDRRRAALWLGIITIVSMLLLAGGLALLRNYYLGSVDRVVLNSSAAAVFFDTLVRFLRNSLRVVAAIGLVIAVAAAIAGPSRFATALRRSTTEGMGSISQSTGLDLGGFSMWVDRHRRALDIVAVIIAAVVMFSVGTPSPGLVLGLAIAVVVWLLIVELLARAHPAPPPYRGQPTA